MTKQEILRELIRQNGGCLGIPCKECPIWGITLCDNISCLKYALQHNSIYQMNRLISDEVNNEKN